MAEILAPESLELGRMPPDVLIEIFGQLGITETSATSQVCKSWSKFCLLPAVLARMQQNTENEILSQRYES